MESFPFEGALKKPVTLSPFEDRGKKVINKRSPWGKQRDVSHLLKAFLQAVEDKNKNRSPAKQNLAMSSILPAGSEQPREEEEGCAPWGRGHCRCLLQPRAAEGRGCHPRGCGEPRTVPCSPWPPVRKSICREASSALASG